MSDLHYIYVIASAATGPVKLGVSAKPDRRIRQLQTGHAAALTLYHQEPIDAERSRSFERLLHRDNAHMRLRGEWFNLSVEDAICMVKFNTIEYDLLSVDELQTKLGKKSR